MKLKLFDDYIAGYIGEMICLDCVQGDCYCLPGDNECKFQDDINDIKEKCRDVDFLLNCLSISVTEEKTNPCD